MGTCCGDPIGNRVDDEFLGRLSREEQVLFMRQVRKMMNT
ncbi:transcriptional regulator HosA [Escherichia marmotae]|nr:transcriptional regulator HosA [Escherichia marmotae]